MKTLTIKEALEQGFTHCGRNRTEWQHLHPIDDLSQIDFEDNEEWFLAEPKGKNHLVDKEQLTEMLADVYANEEAEQTGRDDDEIFNQIKALDFQQTVDMINKVFENNKYFTLTDIKLTYST